MKQILILLVIFSIGYGDDQIFATCKDAKSELVELRENTTTGYKKDSMSVKIILRKSQNDTQAFVQSKLGESSLEYLGGSNPQFLEEVASGHNMLYTYFPKSKILTVQKSYDFLGPIMVNTYLKCE